MNTVANSHIITPELILLNVGYSDLNANWNWKSICSPFARIYYVAAGNALKHIGGKTYNLKANHLYLTPPFTLHDDECNSRFSLYYIHFYQDANNRDPLFEKFDFPLEIDSTELDLHLVKRLLQINPNRHLRYYDPQLYDNPPHFSKFISENNKIPSYHSMETKSILNQLMAKFIEESKIKPEAEDVRINNVLKYIHENTNKDISIRELADIACITEDHFTRTFKKTLNMTPVKYINQKKIEKAQLLLLTSNLSIKEIAFELSIDNISYFNRIFKLHTNITPSEYRKNYGSE